MRFWNVVLVVGLAAVGCEEPDRLCTQGQCVEKTHAECPDTTPRLDAKCDFEGECYYCSAIDPNNALVYACVDGAFQQKDAGIDASDCEGGVHSGTSPTE